MECTPVFHNLFPHSSPLHVYKQSPEEEEKLREREWGGGGGGGDEGGEEEGGEVHGSAGKMSGVEEEEAD